MTSKLVVGFAPPLPNDSPVFRRDFDGLREGTGCCRGGIAGRWTKPVAASPVHGVASEAKSLSRTPLGELYPALKFLAKFLATHLRLGKIGGLRCRGRLDDVTEKRKLVLQTPYLSRTMDVGDVGAIHIFQGDVGAIHIFRVPECGWPLPLTGTSGSPGVECLRPRESG